MPVTHSARRINALGSAIRARRYLEIGVSTGTTFRDVDIFERVGVDPAFAFDTATLTNETTRLVPQTSDAFFLEEPGISFYDIAFIDGLHTFEQVVRDFSNVVLHTHSKSMIILDDTVPSDVYSAHRDEGALRHYRKSVGDGDVAWHGDVFKAVFYIHDFWPGLNYRTIMNSGNPQTLVWRSKAEPRKPVFNDLERISRLSFFDLWEHKVALQESSEDEAISLAVEQSSIRN